MRLLEVRHAALALTLFTSVLAPLTAAAAEADRDVGRVDGSVTWKHVTHSPGSTEEYTMTVTAKGTWRAPPDANRQRCWDGPAEEGWITYVGLEGSLSYETTFTDQIDVSQYNLDDPNDREQLRRKIARKTTAATRPVQIPFEAHERGQWVAENHAVLGCIHVHPKKRKLMFSSSRFNTANNGLQPGEYTREAFNYFKEPLEVVKRAESFYSGSAFEDAWTPGTRTAKNTIAPKVDAETAAHLKENGVEDTISYSFTFFDATPELIVSINRWDTWTPKPPNVWGQPGNSLIVSAELRTSGGQRAPVGAQQIDFFLEEVSKEPGLSLNWPVGAKDSEPDLDFRKEDNPELDVVSRLHAVTRKENVSKASAIVTAYDGGAHGTLVVTAILVDGTKIVGKLDVDRNRTRIPIPRRAEGSKIAEAWLEEQEKKKALRGRTNEADDEAIPAGDGTLGDGLSLYDEYRGIHTGASKDSKESKGLWTRLHPGRKDLVIENRVGSVADEGLTLFASSTELEVTAVAKGYLPETRVVNANRSAGADQHGLRIDWDDHGKLAQDHADTAGAAFYKGKIASADNIESPKDCDGLLLSRKHAEAMKLLTGKKPTTCEADPKWHQAIFAANLAHELGHGVGLGHHGAPSGMGAREFTRYTGAYDRDGQPVTSMRYHSETPFKGDLPCKGTKPSEKCWESKFPRGAIGTRQNDASGDLECLMAYRAAYTWLYIPGTESLHEVPTCRMPKPKRLCTSAAGTALNDPKTTSIPNAPSGWFGNAAVTRPCAKRLRLKSAGP